MLALIVIEFSDVVFAVDSIPAIFSITQDPFIVFTSNIFAILGLRSLYFVLASILDRFYYLKFSLGFILIFVAIKMRLPGVSELLAYFANITFAPHFPNWLSLAFVALALIAGIVTSLLCAPQKMDV